MLPILFATYGAVFLAEIAGDKLLYTTGVLAARYRTAPILCGMAVAFMAKMGAAGSPAPDCQLRKQRNSSIA
jgi:putative Ca2+/H+ antiporter (TMEM165/GDT1 family)